jgi:hypothetical protein
MARTLLARIGRFYRTYPILTALSTQVAWSHDELPAAFDDREERAFYSIGRMRRPLPAFEQLSG